MNSFKLFNRTNKNDILSNNLNGIENKEKDRSKPHNKPLQSINDKNNKHNTSTPSRQLLNKTTTIKNETERNNTQDENELNENDEDNKENINSVNLTFEKVKQHQISKENQKEKNPKSKKEKRKNKKNKKNKSINEKLTSSTFNNKSHFVEGFLHHSSSISKKDSLTGKFIGKQSIHKSSETADDNIRSDILIKNYNEATQFQNDNLNSIKEKQSHIISGSDATIDHNQIKEKYHIKLYRPERKESIIPSGMNQEDNIVTEKKNDENITHSQNGSKEIPSKFKNFDNDSALHLPICLGMNTPSSPAFSYITPINGTEVNSLGDDISNLYFTDNVSPSEGSLSSHHHYKKYNALTKIDDNIKLKNSPLQTKTEKDQPKPDILLEVKEHEYKTNNKLLEDNQTKEKGSKKGKDKQKQKSSKHSKKKDKKANVQLSINTKVGQNVSASSSPLTTPTAKTSHNLSMSNSEVKKNPWNSFKKLFVKKSGRKNCYRNSLSTSIDESHHHTYSSGNSGIMYDWNELRRRMELEENSTVCTESLSAREFAEAIGIPIISSSDEEDDHRLNGENEYTPPNTTHSYYGHTHRSTKSTCPILDMSMFVPPTEAEKKRLSAKREPLLNSDITTASVNTACSFASSTTQDYIDKLGDNSKRKVYEDSQSISNRELNLHQYGQGILRHKIFDNNSIALSLNNERILENSNEKTFDDSGYPLNTDYLMISPTDQDQDHLKTKPSWSSRCTR